MDVEGLSTREAATRLAAHRPDGILALADDALCWTADVAALLGLPFHTPATALALTDKFAQRAALASGGLAVPRSWVVDGRSPAASLDTLEGEVAYPAVLKPRRGEGSRDTIYVASPVELRQAVAVALDDGRVRDLVVEEYLADADGPVAGEGFAGYVSVESAVDDGRVVHLAVNGRTPPADPFRETGFFIPSALDASTAGGGPRGRRRGGRRGRRHHWLPAHGGQAHPGRAGGARGERPDRRRRPRDAGRLGGRCASSPSRCSWPWAPGSPWRSRCTSRASPTYCMYRPRPG